MSIVLIGSTSGSVTLQEPAVAGTTVLTLPATSGNVVVDSATQTLTNKTIQGGTITSGTAVASTSGTSIDFPSIPSWVKRITVMFNDVSLNSTSSILVQLGVGSTPTTTGYTASQMYWIHGAGGYGGANSTSGFPTQMGSATYLMYGTMVFNLLGSNTWVGGGTLINQITTAYMTTSYGSIALGGVLGMVRITTVNGTDTFDAGSINILYE